MSPQRIQLRRTAGWRKPEGAIVVARPSRWGNPFIVGSIRGANLPRMTAEVAVRKYRAWLIGGGGVDRAVIVNGIHELRGHDLACWCALDAPCHADVLLEIANSGSSSVVSRTTQ